MDSDHDQRSLCGSLQGQQSFDSYFDYGADFPSFSEFNEDAKSELKLEIPENCFENLRFDFTHEDYKLAAKRDSLEVVKSKKLMRSRLERLDRSLSESQLKLGNIYALLNKVKYTPSQNRYAGSDSSLENYFSGEDSSNVDVNVQLTNDRLRFDNVCADLSESTNSFLSETYIKSLLGVFPYNNLSKRRSRNRNKNKQKRQTNPNKRRKLSSSSTLSFTSLA